MKLETERKIGEIVEDLEGWGKKLIKEGIWRKTEQVKTKRL